MYRYEDIRHVHLEVTTRCNARCPMCARSVRGRTAPGLELSEITIADFHRLFPAPFLRQLTGLDMCGGYGDPAVAGDLLDIVSHLRAVNRDCRLMIFTNGGAHDPSWWGELAVALSRSSRIVFAIDGLDDTNKIYRRGVSFRRVMANARAFIQAGGDAQWDFIAFRHNEHQVDAAARMSRELGFNEFAVKKTSRFLKSAYDYVPELAGEVAIDRFPIHSSRGEVVGYLQPPSERTLVNPTALRYVDLLERHGSLQALFSATSIACKVTAGKSVFVGAQGYVFPCCWTYVQATAPSLYGSPPGIDTQMSDLVETYGGFQRLDGRVVELRSVVEGPLFEAIEKSWRLRSIRAGRLKVCARTCGTEFPAFGEQFASPQLVPGPIR